MFAKPEVGQVVTVTTKYPESYYYSQEKWRYTTYENLPVLPSQPFDKPNTFRIPALNEPYISERVIALHNVSELEVNGEVGEQTNNTSNIRTVTVSGSKGNEYVVTIEGDEPKSCTCLGFQYRRTCRHLHDAMKTVDPKSEMRDNGTNTNISKPKSKGTIFSIGASNMSKDKQSINGWNDRFALIDKYKPTDSQACTALGVTTDELETARELRAAGRFSGESNINVDEYANLFAVDAKSTKAEKKGSATSHTKPATSNTVAPQTATKPVKEAKKRGRKGSNIANAFVAIPNEAVPAEQFATEHSVSLAVLRQSRRFDKSGLGPVRVKKDKETKQLMIWREVEEG